MLLLWLKRNLKFFVRSFPRRQKNPTTLMESLDKRDRTSKKKIVFVFCVILTIFYIFYYKQVNDSGIDINFMDLETVFEAEKIVNDTNGSPFNVEAYTVSEVDVLYRGLMETVPTRSRQLIQRDNLQKCVPTYINTTVNIKKSISDTEDLDELLSNIDTGGHYIPPACRPRHKVVILVPIRRREEQLRVFLYNMHPFLKQQKLEYRIVVIEQSGTDPFNRGRLFNVGFREIQMMGDYQCVVFHDVDLLPTDYRIQYSCPILPRHLCASIVEEESQSTSNKTKFNGVTAMTVWQYREVNGYSNSYWGGHGEDEDMLRRLQACGLGVTSFKKSIGRYTSLSNTSHTSPERIDNELLKTAVERFKKDGFSNLRYQKLSYAARHLYTRILVDINPPNIKKPF